MTGRLIIAAKRITSGMTPEQRSRYGALMQAVIAQAQTFTREGEGLPAAEVGRVIADAIISKRPRTRYPVGRDAAMIAHLARWISDRMLDIVFARVLKRHLPKDPPTPLANQLRLSSLGLRV
jgi:hypothetical protein